MSISILNSRRVLTVKLWGLRSTRRPHVRTQSSDAQSLDAFFETPSWSVRSLLDKPRINEVTTTQLHHLLRLSALAKPSSEEEEEKLLRALNDHLGFVKEILKVDTSGVEPLCAIREETPEAIQERTVTLESVKEVLENEEVCGTDGRIRTLPRKERYPPDFEKWDVLGLAERKVTKYFVVDRPIESQQP